MPEDALLASVRRWLDEQKLPVLEGDGGRLLTALPLDDTQNALLRVMLATDAAGLVARGQLPAPVGKGHWPRALWVANAWNRSNASPRASLLVADWNTDTTGTLNVDAWRPAGAVDDAQVARFADAFLRGATAFAKSPQVAELGTTPAAA